MYALEKDIVYKVNNRIHKKILTDTEKYREVSPFICDIDFFKKVNDTYGHNAGDAVLKHVAEHFRINSRICNGVYRWGGEEFIVVLPDTNAEQAAEAAEGLRVSIMDSVCHFEDLDIKVTMSFGAMQLEPAISIEENIKAADEKLYKAKESGRNRVIL
ncbi:MAG: GGDEF domain-containing protein [Oscillospiraceae bacterium]